MNYMFGYLKIKLYGNNLIRFINICKYNNIELFDIEIINKEEILCKIKINDFKLLRYIRRKCKVNVKIVQKYGFRFKLYQFRNRFFLLFGVFLIIFILYCLPKYVWSIEVEGNYSYTNQYIINFLEKNGIKTGDKLSSINCDNVEFLLRENLDEITWVSVEKNGTKIIVHIKENYDNEIAKKSDKPYNLIADKNCTIESIITRKGVPAVKIGTEVNEGDIIVCGAIPLLNDSKEIVGYDFVCSDADVYGYFREKYYEEFDLNYKSKIYTNKINKAMKVSFCGKNIYLSGFKKKLKQYEKITDYKAYNLFSNKDFPIAFEKIKFKEFEYLNLKYSDEEANKKANEIINNYIDKLSEKGIQIIENNVTIEIRNDKCVISGDFLLLDKIGKVEYINENDYEISREENIDERN